DPYCPRTSRPIRPVPTGVPGNLGADRGLAGKRRSAPRAGQRPDQGGGSQCRDRLGERPMTHQVLLAGLRPQPLGSYLAGLGLIRVLAEQADPQLTAAWDDDGLILHTHVPDIAAWLVEHYRPT